MPEEGFTRSIVKAVAFSGHRLTDVHFLQFFPESFGSIMNTLVRVNEDIFRELEMFYFFKRIYYEVHLEGFGKDVGNGFVGFGIQNQGKIRKASLMLKVSYVCKQHLERDTGLELALQKIGSDDIFLGSLPDAFVGICSTDGTDQIELAHDSLNALPVEDEGEISEQNGAYGTGTFVLVGNAVKGSLDGKEEFLIPVKPVRADGAGIDIMVEGASGNA